MKKHLLCYVILSWAALQTVLAGHTTSASFQDANALYRNKRYVDAVASYERLISTGHAPGEVYYNLANAYYKNGRLSKAILHYERAKILLPDDEDVQFNLRLAYAGTVDKIEPVPLLFYQRWWQSFLYLLSPSGWGLLTVVIIWCTLGAGLLYLFAGTINAKRNAFLVACAGLIISLFSSYISYRAEEALRGASGAIVMDPSAYVKSSPDDKSTNLFMLHEGTRVELLEASDGWQRIKIANGNSGWISRSAIEQI